MNYIVNRLRERSTWNGIVAVGAALGFAVDPDLREAIIAFAIAAVGLIHVLFPEKGEVSS